MLRLGGQLAAGKLGAAPFPEGISNLVVRFRADQGITLNGADVSQWEDLSGNDDHLVQASATDQPLYVAAGGPTGDGAVRFDGTNNRMTTGAFSSIGQPHHFFFILNSIAWGDGDTIANLGTSPDNGILRHKGSTTGIQHKADGTAGYHEVNATTGTYFLLNTLFSGASSYQELNAASPVSGSNIGGGSSVTSFTIGEESGGSNHWNGEFAEILLYSAEITGGDLTSLEAYFSSRYSLF
jgi:hypothetical protein